MCFKIGPDTHARYKLGRSVFGLVSIVIPWSLNSKHIFIDLTSVNQTYYLRETTPREVINSMYSLNASSINLPRD